jgi:UDP-N-acetylmuramoyl-tripeptide--D-alanyl-D-alanine ligase
MRIEDILKVTSGTLVCGSKDAKCDDFSKDSRTIKIGETYIALKGESFDGNNYYEDAIKNGAKTCILSKKIDTEEIKILESKKINIINVKDTLLALQQIATYKRSLYNIPVIAVTGSVGKTSTKDLIATVMSKKYKVLKTEGNYNNNIGLPLTILRLKDEEAIVVEMGMNHFGEIRLLTNIAKPTLAVITNIGTAHIGILGSRENILKAKLEILEGLQGNTIVINNDNDLLSEWALKNGSYSKKDYKSNEILQNNDYEFSSNNSYNVITYGINNKESNYIAENIHSFEDKSKYTLVQKNIKDEEKVNSHNTIDFSKVKENVDNNKKIYSIEAQNYTNKINEKYNVTVPVGGEHFVLNSLCAIAVGRNFEIPMNKIIEGISELDLTKKRMEILKAPSGATIINDTYNANYDSMKAAINYLKKIEGKRRIAILGDMLELGDYSERLHRAVGDEISNIDILITVGKEAKFIAQNAKIKEIYEYDNNENAIEKIKNIINSNDAILIKASNSMKFGEIVDAIKE